MKESVKTVFQCDFCDKRLFRKDAMERHEHECSRNPENKDACIGCVHCEEYEKEYYFDTYTGEGSRTTKAFRCTKLNQLLFPHKAQRIADKYPESFEEEIVMPNECELYQYFY